jgi:hypothetical protein
MLDCKWNVGGKNDCVQAQLASVMMRPAALAAQGTGILLLP